MTTRSLLGQLGARSLRLATIGCAGLAPALAWAHPGHDGGLLPGLLHPFHGFDHVLAALAVGIWSTRLGGRAVWILPTAFVAAMLGGALLSSAGLVLPMVEVAIAISVAALGLMIALDGRTTLARGAFLMVLFALFHGSAHGLEAPGLTHSAVYAFGMAFGTLVLHASGIGAAITLRARPIVLRVAAAPMTLAGLALLVNRLQ